MALNHGREVHDGTGGGGGVVVGHPIHLHGSSPEHSDYICGIVDTGSMEFKIQHTGEFLYRSSGILLMHQ